MKDTSELKILKIKYRLRALYHNCKSSAAWSEHDAIQSELDGNNASAFLPRSKAQVWETCAGWLDGLIKEL